jgi:non-lysosomal glucosylceramidase
LGPGTFAGPTWSYGRWNQGLTAMWEEFISSGRPGEGDFRTSATESSNVCLGSRHQLSPLGTTSTTFVLAWHFPNRRAWTFGGPGPRGASTDDIVGNYYCTKYEDALGALDAALPELIALRKKTEDFVSTVMASDLSPVVKEAALFNLSTLRCQTFFRTADGRPYGWEGCLDDAGSCPGSCTHVWNYEYATPYLFPRLARAMREIEFLHATSDAGAMSFRVMLPLETKAQSWRFAAADGQYGRIISAHREWRNSGDDKFLRRLWPACKRAMSFSWLPGSRSTRSVTVAWWTSSWATRLP